MVKLRLIPWYIRSGVISDVFSRLGQLVQDKWSDSLIMRDSNKTFYRAGINKSKLISDLGISSCLIR